MGQKKNKNKNKIFPSFLLSTVWYEVQLTDTSVPCCDLDLRNAQVTFP